MRQFMTEAFTDNGRADASNGHVATSGPSKIMNSQIPDPCALQDPGPRLLRRDEVATFPRLRKALQQARVVQRHLN